MDFELIEKILNLFDNCQSNGKSLEINIDQDLLKILPLPRKLILDFLSDQPLSTIFHLSNDQNTLYFQKNFRLCSIDQNEAGSCHSLLCEQFHICKDFILNNNCLQFKTTGKCLYSHSLLTNHNQNILKKFHFSSQNEQIFQLIYRLIKLSSLNQPNIIIQSINKHNITEDLIDLWLDKHKSLVIHYKLINPFTIQFIFDDDEVASMMENFIIQRHSTTALVMKNMPLDVLSPNNSFNDEKRQEIELNNEQTSVPFDQTLKRNDINSYMNIGRGRGRQQFNSISSSENIPNTFSRRLALNDQSSSIGKFSTNEKKFSFSHRLHSISTNEHFSQQIKTNSTDNSSNSSDSFSRYSPSKVEQKQNETHNSPVNNVSNRMISPQNENSNTRFVLDENPIKNKEKSETPITYVYNKKFLDEHLCYLLGPGKRHIIEKDQCQILSCLSSGYCQVKNIQQGKYIEKQLYSILPENLNIQLVKINNDLALIICSSAGELIFQQNQIHYAIISEPLKIQLTIEVIDAPINEHRQSSIKNTRSSPIHYEDSQQSSFDNKFYINTTDSSINVISGDITETPVDLMICISTSNNLRESILRCAGPEIESQYKERYASADALLLNGGLTAARKILFVRWQTEVDQTETIKTQKSLSDLVKWCIEQAHQRNLKSISFPPIGTGQLGLDPAFVCEAMISAASQCLHQYKIDVFFVIYSSNGINDDDECYQVFRIYLDSLCEQIKSTKINNDDRKNQSIQRNVQSKRILTLSDYSLNINENHHLLIKLLKDIIYEKTFDLSLIKSSFVNEIDLLIDICLKYNVIPRIDLNREELTLRGDRDSCFQCFFNLCEGKTISQYSYILNENEEKSDEIKINSFISLKIDEAFAVGESNICLEDDNQMIYNIDLNKLQIQINKNKQLFFLNKKQFNDSKIKIPSTWSSSLLMIRTIQLTKSSFELLECFRAFQETMSIFDWQIERIDSIENYPLYIHFMNKKCEKTELFYHGCSYSSVQSIIHYGLHSTNTSNYGDQFNNSSNQLICLTRDILNSHLYGSHRSTDGKYYIFAVQIAKNDINNNFILLSNKDTYLALPTYLIVYQRQTNFH